MAEEREYALGSRESFEKLPAEIIEIIDNVFGELAQLESGRDSAASVVKAMKKFDSVLKLGPKDFFSSMDSQGAFLRTITKIFFYDFFHLFWSNLH